MKNSMMFTLAAISLATLFNVGIANARSEMNCEIGISSTGDMTLITAFVIGGAGEKGVFTISIRATSGTNTSLSSQQGKFQIDETGRSVVAQSLLGLSPQQRILIELSGKDGSGQRSFTCTSGA